MIAFAYSDRPTIHNYVAQQRDGSVDLTIIPQNVRYEGLSMRAAIKLIGRATRVMLHQRRAQGCQS